MKVRDIIKRIEDDGWYFKRMRGDHRVYKHSTKRGNVVVSGHPSVDPPTGTQANIWKQAGLPKP
jgi:predicted RNA binding protein YcfA (HicA-like mRNA interferase family)